MASSNSLFQDLNISNLPKTSLLGMISFNEFNGFQIIPQLLKATMNIDANFKPLPTDIILASFPKTGTTWLKALIISLLNRNNEVDPLLAHSPHDLIPSLELELFSCVKNTPLSDLRNISSPRLFSTHLPYELLPQSVKDSGCLIICVAQNPLDTFVSNWKFYNSYFCLRVPIRKSFNDFCEGYSIPVGSFFDHVLGYWKAKESRNHMLFLTYEELKADGKLHVKKLAEFLGIELHSEEEIEDIIGRCSYKRLSELEVNKKKEKNWAGIPYNLFFRKGIVGDWKNHGLNSKMVERLDELVCTKWGGSGLDLLFPMEKAVTLGNRYEIDSLSLWMDKIHKEDYVNFFLYGWSIFSHFLIEL